ncbi:50S ribosomal protein L30e [Acidilobus sp.]|uniref:50S ribosomal protein L30e n=1 Tax=Acidilobus sp. TaxID=1872109 RepID=UPI003D05757F
MSEALFERELKAAAKSGKLSLGARRALKLLLKNQAKGIIVADNAPSDVRKNIESLANINGVPLYVYKGTSADLGSLIGKPFKVSVIAILNPGDSRILDVLSEGR